MKFLFTLIAVTLLNLSSFAVQTPAGGPNVTDANNQKQGHWVITVAEKNLPGYAPGQTIEEGYYKDGRKEGKWTKYYPNGKVEHTLTFQNNKLDGLAVFYYKNGKRKEEGIWKKNRWVGDYKYYYKNGNLRNEWKYNETGKRTGVQRYYYKNGQVKIEGAWENGQESGPLVEFYDDGSIKRERFFAAGKLDPVKTKKYEKNVKTIDGFVKDGSRAKNGLGSDSANTAKRDSIFRSAEKPKKKAKPFDGTGFHEFLDKEGRVIKKGTFMNGYLRSGEKYIYDEKGKLIRTYYFRNGKKIREAHH